MNRTFERLWVGLWYVVYVAVRVVLRLLIGKEKRNRAIMISNFHFTRFHSVKYGSILPSYEYVVSRVVKKAMKKGGTFIDVGANRGYFTLMAYQIIRNRAQGQIVAVEADPVVFSELKKNLPQDNRIIAVNKAVYTVDDQPITFYVGGGERVAGSVHPTEIHFKHHLTGETVTVMAIRLDTLIKRLRIEEVNLIKMDIEGAEYPVLIDATLDISNVKNMVIEVHYPYASWESIKIMRSLVERGFMATPLYPDANVWRWYFLAYKGETPW